LSKGCVDWLERKAMHAASLHQISSLAQIHISSTGTARLAEKQVEAKHITLGACKVQVAKICGNHT
jgi:hypothetical protein